MVGLVRSGRSHDELVCGLEPNAQSICSWVAKSVKQEGGPRRCLLALPQPSARSCYGRGSKCGSLALMPVQPEACLVCERALGATVRVSELMSANRAGLRVLAMARVLGV